MKRASIPSLLRSPAFTPARSVASLAVSPSPPPPPPYESIADIFQRELGIVPSANEARRTPVTLSANRRNMPEKKKAFIEENLAAVNEIIRGMEASESAKEAPLKAHSVEDASNLQQGPAKLSSYGIIRLLMSRVSSRNWIELDRDMRNYNIVLRPSEVAWVLKVEKNPQKAWDFFNWASRRAGYKHDSTCFFIMIDTLGKCSNLGLLEDLLSEMERLKIPHNASMLSRLIEVYSSGNHVQKLECFLHKLQELQVEPNGGTYKCLLLAFAKAGNFQKALEIHGSIRNQRQDILDVVAYNALFDALLATKRQESVCNGIRIFVTMIEDGITPDDTTCRSVLKLLSQSEQMNRIIELVHLGKQEKVSKKEVYENLIKALAELGYIQDMASLLRESKDNNIKISHPIFLHAIDAFCQANKLVEALSIMREMEKDGSTVPRAAYDSVVKVLCDNNQFQAAYDVLKLIRERGPPDDAVCDRIVLGLARSGDYEVSLSLFEDMCEWGCILSVVSFNALLQAAADVGDFESSWKLLHVMYAKSIAPDVATYNIVIECFGRAGKLDLALKVFNEMKEKGSSPTVSTYNNIFLALSQWVPEDVAISFYEEMKVQGFFPDAVTSLS